MTLSRPCISSIGPRNAKIALVGEAPGEQEERTGVPFIGSSGQELDRMLEQAGLKRSDLYLTNVLLSRPPQNKLEFFCVKREALPSDYTLPPLSQGKYLRPEFIPEIERLYTELRELRPNIIIAAGGTAAWALVKSGAISKVRGTIHNTPWGKCLPTFHPAAVLRDWSIRPIVIADLIKARYESDFPEVRRPQRFVTIDPSIEEVEAWCDLALRSRLVSCDVETRGGSITCLGFATSASEAIVIPFFDPRKLHSDPEQGLHIGSYWTRQGEIRARRAINRVLASRVPKLFQNGMYDIQYLLKEGYNLCSIAHDTMILHHALFPELQKSLGFLGSIYTNEASWKLMRRRDGNDDFKREE